MYFERFTDKRGKFRWRLRAANGNKIGTSGEGYQNAVDRDAMIDSIKAGVGTADVRDVVPRVYRPRKPKTVPNVEV